MHYLDLLGSVPIRIVVGSAGSGAEGNRSWAKVVASAVDWSKPSVTMLGEVR